MNKIKKRIISILMALIVFFTGCSKSNSYEKTETTTNIISEQQDEQITNNNDSNKIDTESTQNYEQYKFHINIPTNDYQYDYDGTYVPTINHEQYDNYNDIDTSEIENLYEEATTEFSNFLQTCAFSNSIMYFYFYVYMLSEGYLSATPITLTNQYSNFLDLNNNDMLGANLLYGYANSAAIADFYTRVLNKCGYEAYSVPCYSTNGNNFSFKEPNHVVTMVKEEKLFGTIFEDPTLQNILYSIYSDPEIVGDDKDNKAILLPEYSSYENWILPHYDQNTINYIKYLYENDSTLLSSNPIYVQYIYTQKMIDLNSDFINDFAYTYKRNILDKLPNKNR